MYRIRYVKSVRKDVRNIPKHFLKVIIKKIEKLAANPRPSECVKLKGSDNDYRIRHADYRVIYSIQDNELIIFVIKISHRKEVYRDF